VAADRVDGKIQVRQRGARFALALAAALAGARAAEAPFIALPAGWRVATELMGAFPAQGLQLYAFASEPAARPMRAFCLAWDPTSPAVALKPVLNAAGRTPAQFFAAESGTVFAAANGGFFGSGQSFSLVQQAGAVLAPNLKSVTRAFQGANTAYFPTRAAWGIAADGRLAADWIYHVGAGNALIYAYPAPSPNAVGAAPQPVPTAAFPAGGVRWEMENAIGGSPMLVKDGRVQVTDREELIEIDNNALRPRTALGHTARGLVLLLVIEGDNAPGPAGATLAETAALLLGLGCTAAINLDGGGSTSLVAGARTTVRPSGGAERAVASALLWLDPRTQIPVTAAPEIVHPPWDVTVAAGARATLQVAATGGGLAYQWLRDDAPIPGATQAAYTIEAATPALAGRHAVRVTNSRGAVASRAAALTVEAGAAPATLVNLSVRAAGGAGADALVAGFVVRDGAKTVLVRAVGPGLAALGVPGVFPDPRLELATAAGATLAANDDWVPAQTAVLAASLGAFALTPGSRDAALAASIAPGAHLAITAGPDAAARGSLLLEAYDAGGAGALANLSARARVSAASGPLIAGFVVRGPAAMTVLLRAIGPALRSFGVAEALAAPRLELVRDGATLLTNTAWAAAPNAPALRDAAVRAGAFLLPVGSADAAMLVTLAPGAYTAVVTAANPAAEGVALVELYEVR
jgi:hypothetical protein